MNRFILVTDNDGIEIEDFSTESARDERILEILREHWDSNIEGEYGSMPDSADEAYSVWKEYDYQWGIVFYEYEVGGAKDQEILK